LNYPSSLLLFISFLILSPLFGQLLLIRIRGGASTTLDSHSSSPKLSTTSPSRAPQLQSNLATLPTPKIRHHQSFPITPSTFAPSFSKNLLLYPRNGIDGSLKSFTFSFDQSLPRPGLPTTQAPTGIELPTIAPTRRTTLQGASPSPSVFSPARQPNTEFPELVSFSTSSLLEQPYSAKTGVGGSPEVFYFSSQTPSLYLDRHSSSTSTGLKSLISSKIPTIVTKTSHSQIIVASFSTTPTPEVRHKSNPIAQPTFAPTFSTKTFALSNNNSPVPRDSNPPTMVPSLEPQITSDQQCFAPLLESWLITSSSYRSSYRDSEKNLSPASPTRTQIEYSFMFIGSMLEYSSSHISGRYKSSLSSTVKYARKKIVVWGVCRH